MEQGLCSLTIPASCGLSPSGTAAPSLAPAGRSDQFIYGPENALAARLLTDLISQRAADERPTPGDPAHQAVAAKQTDSAPTLSTWHPIVIWGPAGLGKTHLARGIANGFGNLGYPSVTTTASDFVRDLHDARRSRALDEFRSYYRSAALVVVDGIHELSQRPEPQRELSALIDHLSASGGVLVVTAPRSTATLTNLHSPLRSRLAAGLSVPLELPGRAARRALVAQWQRQTGPASPATSGSELASEAESRAVLGLERQPLTPRQLWKKFVTADVAATTLRRSESNAETRPADPVPTASPRTDAATMQDIIAIVARCFSLTQKQIVGRSRRQSVVEARGIAMLLARELTGRSLTDIGNRFGGRDHTTVLHACRKTSRLVATDPATRQTFEDMRRLLTLE